MQVATLTFANDLNSSLQIGDIVYYSSLGSSGGFSTSTVQLTTMFGVVISIGANTVMVSYDETVVSPPLVTDYISFEKDKQVNSSSIIGYYAEATFKNNSRDKVELFAIGSEISESSK
jgi:recombinational DNA repair protein RecT